MNTAIHMTPPQSWARYIAVQLQRAAHFDGKDDLRAEGIRDDLQTYVKKHAPSGSGVDTGTILWVEKSNVAKLVFTCEFHHMNDGGYYDGWTQHKIIVTPTFDGLDVRVSGRNRNDIRDYLGDLFAHWINEEREHPVMIEALSA